MLCDIPKATEEHNTARDVRGRKVQALKTRIAANEMTINAQGPRMNKAASNGSGNASGWWWHVHVVVSVHVHVHVHVCLHVHVHVDLHVDVDGYVDAHVGVFMMLV